MLCILLSSDSLSGCGFERIIDNEAGFCPPLVQRTPSERGHESPERRQGEEIIQYLPLPPPEEDKQSAQVLCSKGRIVTRYRIWRKPETKKPSTVSCEGSFNPDNFPIAIGRDGHRPWINLGNKKSPVQRSTELSFNPDSYRDGHRPYVNLGNKKAPILRKGLCLKLGTDLLSHLLRQYHWLWRA